jgi:hypothetical protein
MTSIACFAVIERNRLDRSAMPQPTVGYVRRCRSALLRQLVLSSEDARPLSKMSIDRRRR